MFNQKPGFGGTSAFGSNMNTFGTSTFGQNSSVFAAKTPAPTAFGTPTFGSSTPGQASMFGAQPASTAASTGIFGAPTAGAFGQPAASTGTTFGFGGTANTGAGMFGATQQQPSTNLFGSTQTSSAFGAAKPAGFSGFGNTTTSSTGLFNQNSSLFGSSTPAASTTGNLFGSTATPAAGNSLFSGNTGFGANQSGTTVKFNPITGTDMMMKNGASTNINTKHQCITTMKEYGNKSIEELRVEDYLANRKGPQAGSTFGAAQPTALFGTTPAAPASSSFTFGADNQNKSMFGTTAGTSLFGQQQQAAPSLFGQPAATGGFSTPTTSATSFGGFGATNNLFKPASSAQQTTGLFGQPAQATTGFGTSFGSTFGSTNTQPTSLFGAKPAFGAATTTSAFSFGTTTTSAGGTSLFGQKPAGSLFNAGATPSFGASSTGFGGFGTTTTTQAGTGLFGAQNTTPGFNFGGTSTAPSFSTGLSTGFGTNLGTSTGSSLFGNAAASKPAFNFGSSLGATNNFGSFGFGTSNAGVGAPLGGANLGTNNQAQQQIADTQKHLLALALIPYGDTPLFRNVLTDSGKREELLKPTNPVAQKALLSSNQLKVSPMPKVKPKNWNSTINNKKSLFDGLEDDDGGSWNETFVPRKSVKRLILKAKPSSPGNTSANNTFNQSVDTPLLDTPAVNPKSDAVHTSPDLLIRKYTFKPDKQSIISNDLNDTIPLSKAKTVQLFDNLTGNNADESQKDSLNMTTASDDDEEEAEMPKDVEPHPTGIVCTRSGYYTIPSLKELADVEPDDGRFIIENFTVGREGYGSVFFPGQTDITGLNIDELVHIRRKEIIVYPDETVKPDVGQGLNKKAEVTLECVWPNNKTTRLPIKSPEKLKLMNYHEKIERSTSKIGAKFLEYRPETGSWLFQVQHFSKYGLEDSDDEDDVQNILKQKNLAKDTSKKSIDSTRPVDMDITKVNGAKIVVDKEPLDAGDDRTCRIPVGMDFTAVYPTTGMQFQRKTITMATANEHDDEMEDITQQTMPTAADLDLDDDDENMDGMPPMSRSELHKQGTRNLQMMKASFFQDDDAEDDYAESKNSLMHKSYVDIPQSTTPILQGSLLRNKLLAPNNNNELDQSHFTDQNMNMTSRNAEPIGLPDDTQSYTLPDLISKHPKVPSGIDMSSMNQPQASFYDHYQILKRLPYSQSFMAGKTNLIADTGLFMGNQSRVGWAPNSELSQSASTISDQSEDAPPKSAYSFMNLLTEKIPEQLDSTYCVHKEKLSWCSRKAQMYEENLKIALNHSKSSYEERRSNSNSDSCPHVSPQLGVEALHQYMQALTDTSSEDKMTSVENQVWSLCIALWGNLPGLDDHDNNKDTYSNRMVRRKALSEWLTSVSSPVISSEIELEKNECDGYLKELFSHLSGQHVTNACDTAQSHGDHRLALLLSQGGGSTITRQMLLRQLDIYSINKADKFINKHRMKILCILAGVMVWQASDQIINTCQGLDWKRALALHLWYHGSSAMPLQQAFHHYEDAFKGKSEHGKYASAPWPGYVEADVSLLADVTSVEDTMNEDDIGSNTYDICYHIIKLYCRKTHRLERLLNPTTYTSNHLDFSLSWHVLQVLQALGYSHLSEQHMNSIHVNFACQLEQTGAWHWAIFVLSHISNEQRRVKSVQDMICRHVTVEADELKESLLKQLNIPMKWLYQAKALKAKYSFEFHNEAKYLLKAEQWNDSHAIIMKHIAPDAIINEDYDELESYLVQFQQNNAHACVFDWANGGQVYTDYIEVSKTTDEIRKRRAQNEEVNPYDIEKLHPKITSLCSRISNLPTTNAKETLCQSEIAKKTANLLRVIISLQNNELNVSSRLLVPHIGNLPMPEDYALQKLQDLTRSYMLEVANS